MKNKKLLIILGIIVGGILGLLVVTSIGTFIFAKVNAKANGVASINFFAEEKDIKLSDDKLNVYFFWGDGCPHCAAQKEYILDNDYKYGSDVNIYGFEVWNNVENLELFKKFAKELEFETNGVPLTIVGDEYMVGYMFGEELDDLIEKQLKNKNREDIYKKIKE